MVKAAQNGPQIATANRLGDGAVVFLAGDGAWAADLQSARVAADTNEAHGLAQAAEEAVRNAQIVGPYLIAVTREAGRLTPLNYRERIRADGPSLDVPRAPATSSRE